MSSFLDTEKACCIILSGGYSSRMKTPKALLRFSENEHFIQHIIQVYQYAGIPEIIVVKNTAINLSPDTIPNDGVEIIENSFPERGRLFSIQLGLSAVPDVDYCFIQNIDNPFVTEDLIYSLIQARSTKAYVTPQFGNKGGHPILIPKIVMKRIISASNPDATLSEILTGFDRIRIETKDPKILVNINKPADYERIFLGNNAIKTTA